MKEIARVPIVQQVVNNMKEYIMSGQIDVGQKLPTEKEWCEKMGVGRGTVREAFRILEAKGLIEIKPGRGAFVAGTKELEKEDIVEWFVKNEMELKDYIEVRQAVEPLVARLVAENGLDEELNQLEKIHRRFIKAVSEDDFLGMARCDEKLHRYMVECTKNKMLIFINRKIDECIWEFRLKTFQVSGNAQNAIKAHGNIIKALKERNPEVAELYAKRHIQLVNVDMDVIVRQ